MLPFVWATFSPHLRMAANDTRPETESPELDEFLSSETVSIPGRVEQVRMMRDVWRRADHARRARLGTASNVAAGPRFDPETLPYRILVMWRITRTTALMKNLCADDETLDAATELDPDPWTTPWVPIGLPTAASLLRRRSAGKVLTLHNTLGGLPLLPPREDPEALERWCSAAAQIASGLGIERSETGLLGLAGLLEPRTCARCDVSPSQVLAFEELLLNESLDMLLDVGERSTIRHFRQRYHFSIKEAQGLLRVVKTQALVRSSSSIEEKRALQEMRLEDYIGRSRDSMDMDGEMKGIKELAKIQGLTRTAPEDQAAEFFNVIAKVSAAQDKQKLPAATLRMLEGKGVENVEATIIETKPAPLVPEEDPDDAEALAEFDNENQF